MTKIGSFMLLGVLWAACVAQGHDARIWDNGRSCCIVRYVDGSPSEHLASDGREIDVYEPIAVNDKFFRVRIVVKNASTTPFDLDPAHVFGGAGENTLANISADAFLVDHYGNGGPVNEGWLKEDTKNGLRRNTVMPGQTISGFIYLVKSVPLHDGDVTMVVANIAGEQYVFPFKAGKIPTPR